MPSPFEYRLRCLFWSLNRPFVKLFLRRPINCVTEPDSHQMPRPPFVLIANHANFFDPWMVGYESPYALYIMMNDDGFRGKKSSVMYLRAIGAFPKKKGAHDYKAMKYTLQILKGGYPVLIFPEGQTSWDGETQPIYSGIEKIVKRAKVPLVIMHLHGNFLSRPWWAHASRKGRIGVRITVHQPETLSAMAEADLLELMKSSIYNNDIKNPENRSVQFTGTDLAKGMERFAWICTQCEAEDALVTDGNVITCTACSASWEVDAYFGLTARMPTIASPGDLHDWIGWHKEQVKKRLAQASGGSVITESSDVVMQTQGAQGAFVNRLTGTLALTTEKIVFTPSDSGARIMEWSLNTVEDYVIQLKDAFEFRSKDDYFRFMFDGHSPMKWVFYIRYMKGYEEIERRGHY